MVNRRLLATLRYAAFLVALVALSGQQTTAEPPRVLATSTRTVQLQPDEAVLTFTVSNSVEGPDKSAVEALDRKIDEVKKALQAVPLDKTSVDIRVSSVVLSVMQSNPVNPGTAPVIHGKKARSVFQVTVREKDFQKLRNVVGRLSEAAVENGGTSGAEPQNAMSPFKMPRNVAIAIGGAVGGNAGDDSDSVNGPTVQWLSSAATQARRDAIRQAVKDAIADAEAACGDKKVTVVQIEVADKEKALESTISQLSSMRGALGGETEQPASPATVKVQVEVRVTCTY